MTKPHPELADTPLDHFLEQRVFDIRDFHVVPLTDKPDNHLPEAYAVMYNGLTFVVLPSFTDGRLELEITAWRMSERAGDTITVTLSHDYWQKFDESE